VRLADYSSEVTVDQLDAALRAGGFEGVFHYTSGGFAQRLELPAVVAGIRERGWPQLAIDVPHLAQVDGAAAARAAIAYGYPAGARLALDVEAAEFDADPAGWRAAADRWCPAVRAAGLRPGVYGPDRALAACANWADWIWRARPDMCDPAGPGLAAGFFAGERVVQCGAALFAGVEMDINFSQFTVEGEMTADEHRWLEGLFNGWFQQQNELQALLAGQKALAAAVAAVQPIDVEQLAQDLEQHLPVSVDAGAVARAVVDLLASRLQAPAQAQAPPPA